MDLTLHYRQRFIQDVECPVAIPEDFSFAEYLERMIAKNLAEVVEITVWDWAVLWSVFLLLFVLNALVQTLLPSMKDGDMPIYAVCAGFAVLQLALLILAVLGFRWLAYIKSMLIPGLKNSELERISSGATGEVDFQKLIEPPRYMQEMKLATKEWNSSWVTSALDLIFPKTHLPSKHQQLFGPLGARGPLIYLHYVKLILLGSVVSIAALSVILFQPLWALSPFLPFLAIAPALICIFLTPRMVILYTWCCSTEMLKDVDVVIEVVRKQKQDKLLDILRILSMLSYFLDQVEFLKNMSSKSASADEQKAAITEAQWEKLMAETDPHVVDDLNALFLAYDTDESGELDCQEVKELVEQMGTKLTDEEAENLFRIMDADGSGTVDFKEFAMVILHQKNAKKGKVSYTELAEKMFRIFDQDGSGVVQQEEILQQISKLGKNWDSAGIIYFLQQIDKDGSGEIEKHEFVDYITKIEAEMSLN
eukprot:768260-Hanusia_phi.AAC.1